METKDSDRNTILLARWQATGERSRQTLERMIGVEEDPEAQALMASLRQSLEAGSFVAKLMARAIEDPEGLVHLSPDEMVLLKFYTGKDLPNQQ